ncbi:MAG: hypothetical protein HOY69_30920, partial [Streptomyces sp.]|nr:hypothetical protein [Streptomyces sp.]
MTTLRPERPADGPMSYENTGQFRAVVEQLHDPLNDPLPGRPPAVPEDPGEPGEAYPEQAFGEQQYAAQPYTEQAFTGGQGLTEEGLGGPQGYPEPPLSPWFHPPQPPAPEPPQAADEAGQTARMPVVAEPGPPTVDGAPDAGGPEPVPEGEPAAV